jgi:hypothetical protein
MSENTLSHRLPQKDKNAENKANNWQPKFIA